MANWWISSRWIEPESDDDDDDEDNDGDNNDDDNNGNDDNNDDDNNGNGDNNDDGNNGNADKNDGTNEEQNDDNNEKERKMATDTKADKLKEYETESLIEFLRGDSKIKHIEVGDLFTKLEEKKITGDSFLKLSGWDFKEYGMLMR
ncbi:hypothetical protein RCL_jg10723.t1 [Rhizophagus clarus]|uniref:Uncharacterized protein n=1 Tax=Rhizophagus clarus TaxID=94130 RepID=A0A8H3L631_9GLOM|nr:hypothetical protein RCL_jg10723.t1 [Rhizophagus clarus]